MLVNSVGRYVWRYFHYTSLKINWPDLGSRANNYFKSTTQSRIYE